MNIALLGPRASGKTTIGRAIAQLLVRPFVDLDDMTRAQFSEPTIEAIWKAHGEQAWREAEVAALCSVLSSDHQIIALGGGTPTVPAAAAQINARRYEGTAFTIYLRLESEVLRKRLAVEMGDRPSLTGAPPADEIAAVTAQREATYRSVADYICNADDRTIEEIVAELERLLAR